VWHCDCVNQLSAQNDGGPDGRQSSVARRVRNRRSHAAGPTVRELRPPSSAGYRSVFDRDSAPVARGLGGDLGDRRLIVLGYWLIPGLDLSAGDLRPQSPLFRASRRHAHSHEGPHAGQGSSPAPDRPPDHGASPTGENQTFKSGRRGSYSVGRQSNSCWAVYRTWNSGNCWDQPTGR
jgi:hypothetical protein